MFLLEPTASLSTFLISKGLIIAKEAIIIVNNTDAKNNFLYCLV